MGGGVKLYKTLPNVIHYLPLINQPIANTILNSQDLIPFSSHNSRQMVERSVPISKYHPINSGF